MISFDFIILKKVIRVSRETEIRTWFFFFNEKNKNLIESYVFVGVEMDVLGLFIASYLFLDLISQDKVYGWMIIGCISCLGSHGYCENFKSHFPFFFFYHLFILFQIKCICVYIYIYICVCACTWLSSIVPAGLEIVQSFNPRLRFKDPVNLES